MNNFNISYISLSVGLCSPFIKMTHLVVVPIVQKYFLNWKGFFDKYDDFDLGIRAVTQHGTEQVEIRGPSVSRKYKVVNFSIFLPEKVGVMDPGQAEHTDQYLDWLFFGLATILSRYKITEAEVEKIKHECKNAFGMSLDSSNF